MFPYNSLLPFYFNNYLRSAPSSNSTYHAVQRTDLSYFPGSINHLQNDQPQQQTAPEQNSEFLNLQSAVVAGSSFVGGNNGIIPQLQSSDQPVTNPSIVPFTVQESIENNYSLLIDDISSDDETSGCNDWSFRDDSKESSLDDGIVCEDAREVIITQVAERKVLLKQNASNPILEVIGSVEESGVSRAESLEEPKHNKKVIKRLRRKQERPRKSAIMDDEDPGIVFTFQTKMVDRKPELVMEPYKSSGCRLQKRVRKRRRVCSTSSENQSGSDLEMPVISPPRYFGKQCASCGTRKTPLWRDAEDGTPLCNACGIRYKKYKIRCTRCWHIPKKDNMVYPKCSSCGSSLRYAFARKSSYYFY